MAIANKKLTIANCKGVIPINQIEKLAKENEKLRIEIEQYKTSIQLIRKEMGQQIKFLEKENERLRKRVGELPKNPAGRKTKSQTTGNVIKATLEKLWQMDLTDTAILDILEQEPKYKISRSTYYRYKKMWCQNNNDTIKQGGKQQ